MWCFRDVDEGEDSVYSLETIREMSTGQNWLNHAGKRPYSTVHSRRHVPRVREREGAVLCEITEFLAWQGVASAVDHLQKRNTYSGHGRI